MAANNLKVFKSSSKLTFRVDLPEQRMLSSTVRGDVFLREGAIHMRVDYGVGIIQQQDDEAKGKYGVINLQTGRVWLADDCAIEHVRAVVTLEGE